MKQADRDEIEQLMARLTDLRNRINADGRVDLGLRLEGLRSQNRLDGIRATLLTEFAASRGWTIAQTRFGIDELATLKKKYGTSGHYDGLGHLIDHAQCFRSPRRPYRPAALLTHSYQTDIEMHVVLARRLGLAVEPLEWSWYYPGSCLAALYIRI